MDIKNFVLSYYKDATENFNISRIENPTGALTLHTHDYFQVYYISSGSIYHHLEDGSALLNVGDMFITPPQARHYISKTDEDSSFYAISFMPDFFNDFEHTNKTLADFLKHLTYTPTKSIQPRLTIKAGDSILIKELLERIYDEFNMRKISSEDVIRECTALLITIFARNYFYEQAEDISLSFASNKQAVLHSINYIKSHYNEDISLENIAKHSAMSVSCFCHWFSKITGTSFNSFLNKIRIERAIELILTDHKITTASDLCGYDSFSTFYRNFKRFTGLSPAQFKKENSQSS